MNPKPTILVVEDKQNERLAIARLLAQEDYEVKLAENPEQAMAFLDDSIELVISDLRMGENSGVDLLRLWKNRRPATPFIIVTAHGDVTSAVEAMKLGADDYLTKPVNPDELLILIARCLESHRKDDTIRQLQERLDERLGFEKIIGQSKSILDVFEQARLAAQSDCTVLITGESGTGKELIAEALHQNSPRKSGPFITVNMAAVPEHLVESELFGHVKGAFTGAMAARIGRFEAAHGGTLFIDEIGDFALSSQAKLLRVLENHTVTPIGSNDDKQVDVRSVAATSRHIEDMVRNHEFREDLYYRLNVVTIHLPPLRERPEDIPLLVAHFLKIFSEAHNKPNLDVDPALMQYLESFAWPGNVRQLKNTVESMVVLASNHRLTLENLPATLAVDPLLDHNRVTVSTTSLVELQRAAVEKALADCNGHRTRAAESLGISVRTLQRKLKAWGMERENAAT
ncbi:MAG: sigma-54 dependent transcriptional regulator, partial [Planctomycetaceae bacterium]|nr:sigma-54 dependent transcriptional regulator [Planctomycetaceae bacterium]